MQRQILNEETKLSFAEKIKFFLFYGWYQHEFKTPMALANGMQGGGNDALSHVANASTIIGRLFFDARFLVGFVLSMVFWVFIGAAIPPVGNITWSMALGLPFYYMIAGWILKHVLFTSSKSYDNLVTEDKTPRTNSILILCIFFVQWTIFWSIYITLFSATTEPAWTWLSYNYPVTNTLFSLVPSVLYYQYSIPVFVLLYSVVTMKHLYSNILGFNVELPSFKNPQKNNTSSKVATGQAPLHSSKKPLSEFVLEVGTGTGILASRGHNCNLKRGARLKLTLDDACQNIAIFGGTGMGKTFAGVEPILYQMLQYNFGGLIFDIKGDFYKSVDKICTHTGHTVEKVGLKEGQTRLNLLTGLTPEVAAQFFTSALLLGGGIPSDMFWVNSASSMALGALGCLKYIGKYDLAHLYLYIFDDSARERYTDMARKMTKSDTLNESEKEYLLSYISVFEKHFSEMPKDTKGNILATVQTVLIQFTNPDIKRAFCTHDETGFQMSDVVNKGKIFLVDVPMSIYGSSARVILMWIKLLLFNVMQQRTSRPEWKTTEEAAVFFICDEYQDAVACSPTGLSDLNFWDKSRSSRMVGIISSQHVDSFYAVIGNKDVANTILGNFTQTICFKTKNENTINMLNSILGKVEIERETTNSGESYGQQVSSSSGTAITTVERNVLDANMVRNLVRGQAVCLCESKGQSYDDICEMSTMQNYM